MADEELSRIRREAGRKGGLKGGYARTEKTKLRGFASMTFEQRQALAMKGVNARKRKRALEGI